MFSAVVLLSSLSQATSHPLALPHTWMYLVDSHMTLQGMPITFRHYVDIPSASISPQTGFRRIWEKTEWHPPKGKGLTTMVVYVEIDCAGHRSRNLAFEDSETGFLDNEKTADWQPVTATSFDNGLCTIPEAEFVAKR